MEGKDKLFMQVKILTKKREQLFSRIQRMYESSSKLLAGKDKDDVAKDAVLLMYPKLKETVIEMKDLDIRINEYNLMIDSETIPTFTEYEDLVDRIEFAVAKFGLDYEKRLTVVKPVTTEKQVNGTSSKVRLQRIEIPVFEGQQEKWPVFSSLVRSLVIDDKELSDLERAQYLIGRLGGSAFKICSSIPPTGENFQLMWKTLTDRYDDRRVVVNSYLDQIFSLKPLQNESKAGLALILDEFCAPIAALKRQNIENLEDQIFLRQGLRLLDSRTGREFEAAFRDKEMPSYKDFVTFVERQLKTLNALDKGGEKGKAGQGQAPRHALLVQKEGTCMLCPGDHELKDCPRFLKLNPYFRFQTVRARRLCFKCLSKEHRRSDCTVGSNCQSCQGAHHSLLHYGKDGRTSSSGEKMNNPPTAGDKESTAALCSTMETQRRQYSVLLATAVVTVVNSQGGLQEARFLLDSGSQSHFLTYEACVRLGLAIRGEKAAVVGFGGDQNVVSGCTSLKIASRFDERAVFSMQALVVDRIVDRLPSQPLSVAGWDRWKELPLADDGFFRPGVVDGLIGAELFPLLLRKIQPLDAPGKPVAVHTSLGCVIMGKMPILERSEKPVVLTCISEDLERILKRFWEVEEVCTPAMDLYSDEDRACEKEFLSTYERLASGRFVVSLPFKEDPLLIGESYSQAQRRLLALENRIYRQPEIKRAYDEVFQDYLDQGHMSVVSQPRLDEGYYIPHHGVFKPGSSSTPLRIVFDASAKTLAGKSLNEVLMVGPKLQTDVFLLLLNFRLFPVALTADIKQMYRQILIKPDQRKFQRVLWRFNRDDPIQIYEMATVSFGLSVSPYLALRTVKLLMKLEEPHYPLVAQFVPRDMYMDDLVTSVETVAKARELKAQAQEMFAKGGFHLTKWGSNRTELLDARESKPGNTRDFSPADESYKVLGIKWSPTGDTFSFQSSVGPLGCSKRQMLSLIARIFDPLGFLAPVVLYVKLIIKKLWEDGLGWDEIPPLPVVRQWETFLSELSSLEQVGIPRCVGLQNETVVSLVGFCDASQLGYGAVVYIKVEGPGEQVTVSLLCGKSKVAPSKVLSIPRLELCAAVLLARLLDTVHSTISTRHPLSKVFAFSDSEIVLFWLAAPPSRWETFVANRVAKIQSHRFIEHWNHIDGIENPADCLSRGISPRALQEKELWWTGPAWLVGPNEVWPIKKHPNRLAASEVPEARRVALITTVGPPDNRIRALVDRVSSYSRLLRVMVRVLSVVRLVDRDAPLQGSYLEKAELYLCKVAQAYHFEDDVRRLEDGKPCSNRLQRLHPFLKDGVIRVGGRLGNTDLTFDEKHPIVLPKKDPLTIRIIDYWHKVRCHAGPQLLLASLRTKFWILSAREVVRNRVRACNRCFRVRPTNQVPIMGDLPKNRFSEMKAFFVSGVDYAGPFMVSMGKSRKPIVRKAYLCLFICFSTKAVHLELVSDLSTPMFLTAFKRFLSRRGECRTLYSDCGTNFVGAKAELDRMAQFFQSQEFRGVMTNGLADFRIDWHFSPPAAPHFGGLWEANIKSAKTHLLRVIGDQVLTYEELNTVFVQVEAVLNSRPLCVLSEDPSDPQALSPAHFLLQKPIGSIPAEMVGDVATNRLSRFQLLDRVVQSFWKRWKREYLHELQVRSKWSKPSVSIALKSIVILEQPNCPPLTWPLGVVEEVFPGKDGAVRVVLVRTMRGTFKRPVTRVFPLPTQ